MGTTLFGERYITLLADMQLHKDITFIFTWKDRLIHWSIELKHTPYDYPICVVQAFVSFVLHLYDITYIFVQGNTELYLTGLLSLNIQLCKAFVSFVILLFDSLLGFCSS